MSEPSSPTRSREQWLLLDLQLEAADRGEPVRGLAGLFLAQEAIASTALALGLGDLGEQLTAEQWIAEKQERGRA